MFKQNPLEDIGFGCAAVIGLILVAMALNGILAIALGVGTAYIITAFDGPDIAWYWLALLWFALLGFRPTVSTS